MSQFDNLKDKAQDQLDQHPEQSEKMSDKGIEQGGDAADKATGGKFDDKLDKGQESLDDKIGE